MKELIKIQKELNVPKNQFNSFGKYHYRHCEDILKAVKPLLEKNGCILLLSDEVKEVGAPYSYETHETDKGGKTFASRYNGTRVYVEATATIINSAGEKQSVKALAREEVAKKGMDAAQITGSASSYARKYALNGLFAIDDSKDADYLNKDEEFTRPQVADQKELLEAFAKPAINQAMTADELLRIFNDYVALQENQDFLNALTARRKALGIKNSNEK